MFSFLPGAQLSLICIGAQKGCSSDISVFYVYLEGRWEGGAQSWRTLIRFLTFVQMPLQRLYQKEDRMETKRKVKGRQVLEVTDCTVSGGA